MMDIHFLTGNSFPMNLIRRAVRIEPETLDHYRERLRGSCWDSYWGHVNTLAAVNAMTGADLTPSEPRPALEVDQEGYPMFHGKSYRECWVLCPEYRKGYRPDLKTEVSPADILSWQVLRISWD